MAETHLIRIYRSEITTPNTTTDPVIAIEYSIGPQAHNYSWAESIGGWPTGRFYVYAVSEDLAGNKSSPSAVEGPVYSFDANTYVSSSKKWKIGEFNLAKIGQVNT
jgi:hypothetical protein|tara:strand:- start:404 stop:721 length:318 start_codon:yes stop_codon:yes gene_type:complete